MVEKLFARTPPRPGMKLLDPGCGTGAFIEGVLRWVQRSGSPAPCITGIDSDPTLLRQAASVLGAQANVTLIEADFLHGMAESFDYIIGNPPYVSITALSADERDYYRRQYSAASGRFDLYALFFEQAMRVLAPKGRLVFITPEKFAYVQSAARLRQQLAEAGVEEVAFLSEDTFAGLVTYPVVTTLQRDLPTAPTRVFPRHGDFIAVSLPTDGSSWLPHFNGHHRPSSTHTLSDAFVRISCGVATGADQIYVVGNV
ncbi:MAG: methyltransferase domain-containing protein, partial [Gemmatimonadota bacterium]